MRWLRWLTLGIALILLRRIAQREREARGLEPGTAGELVSE